MMWIIRCRSYVLRMIHVIKALKGLQQKLKSIAPPDLAAEVIASKRGLENLMKWCWLDNQDPTQLPELLVGWRREFGLVLLNTLANG